MKKLFQISEVSKACGVSRSTIMRMEEKGLLKPTYVSPDSGRRYYDNFAVAHILQVGKLRSMGLTNDEIIKYYSEGGKISDILPSLEARLSNLQRGVEEFRLRSSEGGGEIVSEMILPEVYCMVKRCTGLTIQDKYNEMFAFYGECVKNGYELSDEPLFAIQERTDFMEGRIGTEPYAFSVCVPVKDRTIKGVERLAACRVLSVLYYGDYGHSDENWLKLGKELRARNLKPAGYPRSLGIVAPYTGKEMDASRYCSRLVIPIEGDEGENDDTNCTDDTDDKNVDNSEIK